MVYRVVAMLLVEKVKVAILKLDVISKDFPCHFRLLVSHYSM